MSDDYVEAFFDQLHKRFAEAEMNNEKKAVSQGNGRCRFNRQILCDDCSVCAKCGWNPKVERRRKAQIRLDRMEEMEGGE